jgi:hypothetical protein
MRWSQPTPLHWGVALYDVLFLSTAKIYLRYSTMNALFSRILLSPSEHVNTALYAQSRETDWSGNVVNRKPLGAYGGTSIPRHPSHTQHLCTQPVSPKTGIPRSTPTCLLKPQYVKRWARKAPRFVRQRTTIASFYGTRLRVGLRKLIARLSSTGEWPVDMIHT